MQGLSWLQPKIAQNTMRLTWQILMHWTSIEPIPISNRPKDRPSSSNHRLPQRRRRRSYHQGARVGIMTTKACQAKWNVATWFGCYLFKQYRSRVFYPATLNDILLYLRIDGFHREVGLEFMKGNPKEQSNKAKDLRAAWYADTSTEKTTRKLGPTEKFSQQL